jgi:dimethylargininase
VTRALVRRPSPRLAEGLISHIDRTPVDVDLALEQWRGYVDAMAANGWDPVEVDPVDECPDGVFIEDSMLVYKDLAVIARSGAPIRRGELATAEAAITAEGYRVERIAGDGTLDDHIYVGRGGRTNDEGIAQLARHLEPLGAKVIAVPVTKVLHLKSAVTALPDGTVIGYLPLVDDVAAYNDFMEVPEEPGSHVVLLGDDKVLMASSAPQTADLLRNRGLEPVIVDISEFERLEGCVTCLSVRLRG